MTLVEALRELGIDANAIGSVRTGVVRTYDDLRRAGDVLREPITGRFDGRLFLVVPLNVYTEGEIAEEWCVSSGAPPETPRTIFLLRTGEWRWLGRERDPLTRKWATFPLKEKWPGGV